LILLDELQRLGSQGVSSLVAEGISLALPPLLYFGSETLKDKYVESVIKGEKIIA
jgi:alkylation response protein AidB-like acyl-CoA dehydrogenase